MRVRVRFRTGPQVVFDDVIEVHYGYVKGNRRVAIEREGTGHTYAFEGVEELEVTEGEEA